MSFENIQLPPFLIQDLYRNFLIDDKMAGDSSHTLKNAELPVIGANKKNILIVLKEQSKAVVDKKDQTFLEGILKACNLNIDDTAVLNIHGLPDIEYTKLLKDFEPGKVLLFGVEPAEIKLPLLFPHNQIQQHISQLYVSFPSLKTIAAEKPLKQALWTTLQKLFNLN